LIAINVPYLLHQLFISRLSSTCRGPYAEADAKTNDMSHTRVAREMAKNWRRGEKLKNVCARHLVLGSLYLLVNFPSVADAVVAAVAGNSRRRLPQQPATATTS